MFDVEPEQIVAGVGVATTTGIGLTEIIVRTAVPVQLFAEGVIK